MAASELYLQSIRALEFHLNFRAHSLIVMERQLLFFVIFISG